MVKLQDGIKEALNAEGFGDTRKYDYLSIISDKDGRLSKRKDYYVEGSEPGDIYFSGITSKTFKSLLVVPIIRRKVWVEYVSTHDGKPDRKQFIKIHYDPKITTNLGKSHANKFQMPSGNVLDGQVKMQVRVVLDEKDHTKGLPMAVITLKGMDYVFKDAGVLQLGAIQKDMPADALFTKILKVTGSLREIPGRDGTSKVFMFEDAGSITSYPELLKHVDMFKKDYETFTSYDSDKKD